MRKRKVRLVSKSVAERLWNLVPEREPNTL